MKRIILMTLMVLSTTAATIAQTYDFNSNGIYYTKIPCGEMICTSFQVTVAPNPSGYSGDIVLPATVTYDGTTYEVLRIGANAFADCNALTSVTASEGYLAMVAYNAFKNCPNLKKVDLPSTLNVLDDNLFSGCPSLDSIVIRATTPPVAAFEDPFSGLNDHAVVVVRCGSLPAYQQSPLFAEMTVVDDCEDPLAVETPDETKSTLMVWPNPAKGTVHIDATTDVEIIDLAGRTIRRQQSLGSTITTLSLDGIAPGVYLLRSGKSTVKLAVLK